MKKICVLIFLGLFLFAAVALCADQADQKVIVRDRDTTTTVPTEESAVGSKSAGQYKVIFYAQPVHSLLPEKPVPTLKKDKLVFFAVENPAKHDEVSYLKTAKEETKIVFYAISNPACPK